MKLLLVLVYAIVVFTVDGRDFSRESEIHDDTENEDQLFPEELENQGKSQYFLDGSDGNNIEDIYDPAEKTQLLMEKSLVVADGQDESDSAYDAYQMKDGNLYQEGRKEQPNGKLRKSHCKCRNACVVMGGFCVTNATLCTGRLVPEGCTGINCQCCVPGTIEAKFDNLEEELQSLKENMNSELQTLKVNMNNSNVNANSKLQSIKVDTDNMNSELQTLKVNMNSSNVNANSMLQSLKVDTDNMNSTLNSKLDLLAQYIACPNGLFGLRTSNQCFKFLYNSSMSWTAAKEKCISEGLALAKPEHPVELRRYLVLKYGDKYAWVGGQGTGSTVNWDRDGTTLSSSNPAWLPGYPGHRTSSSYCLLLLSHTYYMDLKPNNPYSMNGCTASYYPLCELLMG